jgi:glycosyltransferase involved in cell wall biosynthesis
MRKYSVIIPVYNRPDELDELLESIQQQTLQPFEILVIDDGSTRKSEGVIEKFSDLNIHYHFKRNTGQGYTRNFGYSKAEGDYFLVFDSDCILPPHYLETVNRELDRNYLDAYGGPDQAHPSFTIIQKAINYSMTSIFTTGGIRGKKKHAGTFHPRSFNMGISRKVFEETDGYILTRMGEDIEFSIRIIRNGFTTGLIEDAYVYHKRRTGLIDFWKQLHFFGRARVNVNRFFPGELKLFHLFPLFFFLGFLLIPIVFFINPVFTPYMAFPYILFALLIFFDSSIRNKTNVVIGTLSILTSFIQLFAYATGLIRESFR